MCECERHTDQQDVFICLTNVMVFLTFAATASLQSGYNRSTSSSSTSLSVLYRSEDLMSTAPVCA